MEIIYKNLKEKIQIGDGFLIKDEFYILNLFPNRMDKYILSNIRGGYFSHYPKSFNEIVDIVASYQARWFSKTAYEFHLYNKGVLDD